VKIYNDKKKASILYYGAGWPTNIGNAFIDLGAQALIKQAVPEAQVFFASEMPRWLLGYKMPKYTNNAFDIAAYAKCDFLIFSGMAMCEEFVKVNGPSVLEAKKRGVKVILLGTGGELYDQKEYKIYSEFLKELEPLAFISRDKESFESYKNIVENSIEGIDCGFFLPLAYQPPELDIPSYTVINFDSMPIPKDNELSDICSRQETIYTHHECWGPIPEKLRLKPKTLISDIPEDYLTLYANADKIYTDRVHSCVAALSYGKKAKLFHHTLRGGLLNVVGANQIRDELISISIEDLNKRRELQINILSKIIKENITE
jgi:hypothetical protein